MFETALAPVIPQAFIDKLLGALTVIPSATLWATATIRLFKAGPSPITKDSVIADFTPCAFNGYTEVTWDVLTPANVNLPSGNGRGANPSSAVFVAGSSIGAGEMVLGYYVVDSGATEVYMAEYFPAPIPMATPGDFIDVSLLLPLNFVNPVFPA